MSDVRYRLCVWIGLATLVLLTTPAAHAEQVEIVTYYPSPSTTTDDLRVKRATVGSNYRALNLDDPLAAIPDGTLLVEGSVGIGTSRPPLAAPDGSTAGNLTVNDIFLRSMNAGAGAWASQALAAGTDVEPTKPYTVYVNVPIGRISVMYDVFTELALWKYGVTRDKVTLRASWFPYWAGAVFGGGGRPSSSVDWPVVKDGAIVVNSRDENNGGVAAVQVTW